MLISPLNSQLQHQLHDLLAPARSALELILSGGQRPALALVPTKRQPIEAGNMRIGVAPVGTINGIFTPRYSAITGPDAHAAVRTHANPVTEAWSVLCFGKTKTGNTGHSQTSRFAT